MTPAWQLTIDGREVLSPPRRPRRLTDRQRELLRHARARGMTTSEARRFYADPSGALSRLERAGVLERVGRGRWRAT